MKKLAIVLCVLMLSAMVLPFTVSATPFHVDANPAFNMPKASPSVDGSISSGEGWSSPVKFNEDTVGYYGGPSSILTGSGNMYFAYDDNGLYFAMEYTDLGAGYCVKVFNYGNNVDGRTIVVADANAGSYKAEAGAFPTALPNGEPINYYVAGKDVTPSLDSTIDYALAYWFSTGEKDVSNSILACDDEDYISDDGAAVWNGDVFRLALNPLNKGAAADAARGYAIGIDGSNNVLVADPNNADISSTCTAKGSIASDGMSCVFEVMIPWTQIAADYGVDEAELKADTATYTASVIYYDRFLDPYVGDNDDCGRYITVNKTGTTGTTNGDMGLSFGGQSATVVNVETDTDTQRVVEDSDSAKEDTKDPSKDTTTAKPGSTTKAPSKSNNSGSKDSAQTFDAGIAVAVGCMAVSAIGIGYTVKRKK